MGLPLSRFQLMSGLVTGIGYAEEAISQFKMVCIVLPDPYDASFRRRMRERFMDLHEQTGKDMLFITFIEPPLEWLYKQRSVNFTAAGQMNLFTEHGCDDRQLISMFIRSVAPEAQLPAIVVTDNLLSGEYVVLETSESRFEHQLLEIGALCTNSEDRVPVTDTRFLNVLNDLGRYQVSSTASRPIAAILADVFAVQPDNYDGFSNTWADARLRKLEEEMNRGDQDATLAYYNYQASIDKAKRSIGSRHFANAPEFSHRPPMGGGSLTGFMIRDDTPELERTPTFYMQYKIDENKVKGFRSCEALSKDNIDQFNSQLQFFIRKRHPSEEEIMYTDSAHTRVRSFMPLSCFINDFMEREIRLSLVQQMRQQYGIEMPEYFARFKPKCWASVITGDGTKVSLNLVKHPDVWVAPMFGQSMYAYEAMSAPLANPGIPDPLDGAFMSLWKVLLDCRNTSDHAQLEPDQIMNYPLFFKQYNAFSQILDKYLWKMMEIKNRLRG